ncbi:hypothetical protein AGABI2DRAFT_190377 [Agaricus bisporus var. bisporus H97]|uniref:hypothetical protein n=1 Tax=Agaricus bisporus var. bisporus (strain H97 / ATCC MYA-4626 / FGSC 10389) TaxID=936046 RepID=UPI00029F64B7|nr:hypothetical protein AGABI2DRAFT_190377 [Agaricus bisporus var. bisporus H97]EKV49946.1 hypothetical protein AGABI2DRAFT_190377 [Agaricus bisporus var. bisporus H97]
MAPTLGWADDCEAEDGDVSETEDVSGAIGCCDVEGEVVELSGVGIVTGDVSFVLVDELVSATEDFGDCDVEDECVKLIDADGTASVFVFSLMEGLFSVGVTFGEDALGKVGGSADVVKLGKKDTGGIGNFFVYVGGQGPSRFKALQVLYRIK